MKNSHLTNPLKMLAACALLASAASGFAATTWTPGAGCADNAQCTTTAAGSTSSAVAGVIDGGAASAITVKASAYAVNAGSTFTTAKLYDYGSNHLGVLSGTETSGSAPDHAMDNNGATELISLKFSSALVSINSITTGYASGDSDMSLLAYTANNGTPLAGYDIAGKSIADLLTSGWSLVATVNGTSASGGAAYTGLNSTGITSSWWLVSAYNSGYGGSTSLSAGNDYTKLLSVAGNVTTPPSNRVPEPGSLALMGAAFCAALAVRRRQTKSV